jgi:hypothetical protein
MKWLVFIGFMFLMCVFPYLRCFVLNINRVLIDLPRDVFLYFLHRKYNNVPVGRLIAIIGMWGRGKTLTIVKFVVDWYMSKNNKLVWCPRRKKLVRQRIKIISNVELKIPYEHFASLEQIVYCSENNKVYDDEHNTLTVTLVIGDEFSAEMNNRQFKTNIDPLTLNTILTCRHHYIAIYYTTQRFHLVDALLRQVTTYAIDCYKIWRLQGLKYYDAWELENAASPILVKPIKRSCWYVQNKHYNMYDTLACVDNLKKAVKAGDMISEEEILALQSPGTLDMGQVLSPSRKYKRVQKRMYK